jgi:probable addiction module antidote protein
MTKRKLFAEVSEGFEALAEHREGRTTLRTFGAHSKAPVVSDAQGHSHDEYMVEMIKADPEFAKEYLAVALEEVDQPGGMDSLRVVLGHVVQAQGVSAVAERAGISRASLTRSLGPKGNPTVKTLLAILSASGLHLSVSPRAA